MRTYKAIAMLLLIFTNYTAFCQGKLTPTVGQENLKNSEQLVKDPALTVQAPVVVIQDPVKVANQSDTSVRNRLSAAPTKGDTLYYGTIYLLPKARSGKITVKGESKGGGGTKDITIDHVDLRIEGFQIVGCAVYSDLGIFQQRSPISLVYYNQGRTTGKSPRKADKLKFTNVDQNTFYLPIGEVIGFDPTLKHKVSLADYDITLRKDTGGFAYPFHAVPIADNIINFSVFTDIVGLFGEPNGLVQFEADAQVPLTHTNIRNRNAYLFRSIRPYFNLIRLDKEFQTLDIRNELSDKRLDDSTRPNVFRQAFMRGGIDLNLYSANGGTNYYSFFVGSEFRQTKLLISDNNSKNANIISGYIGGNFSTRALDNFVIGADMRYYFISHLIRTQDYENERLSWLVTGVTAAYNPPSNPQSKVFLRLNYNFFATAPGHDFVQVQVGYKTALSKRVKSSE